jgi:AbrB family looped-hinge helix DNA binding protein
MIKSIRFSEGENMKISERGQVTIPKTLRERFGLYKDVEIDLLPVKEGLLLQKRTRRKHPVDSVWGVLKRPGATDPYVEEVRGR